MENNAFKEVELTEEQLKDPNAIINALFGDPNDPRSNFYQRKLVRPEINWLAILAWALLPIAGAGFLIWLLLRLQVIAPLAIWLPIGLWVVFVLCFLKRIALCLVKLYQRYAPASIRNKCRYEPSCSEYMRLSIEKYGFFKGLSKGIGRLKRCNTKGGGFDEP